MAVSLAAPKTLATSAARSREDVWQCPFVVNGRFYSQTITGVQRYAREVILAMDAILQESCGRSRIMVPVGVPHEPVLNSFDRSEVGPFRGHFWEQTSLARSREPILSLCNTGPLAASAQIVCIHDANVFVQADSYSKAFVRFYRMLLPLLARRALRVATVSNASALQLKDVLQIPLGKIEVLANGHEHAFRWNAEASSLATSKALERPFVLVLGSRARHKNIQLILGLAEALDALGLDIVVAGGGANIFSSSEFRVAPNVRELGRVSDDDLAFLYARAVCLAFPSRTEGFGIPLVEAMALGCPVVSSDRSSMPEVCGGAALLASPDDRTAWLSHIASLAESRSLREQLIGRGREQVGKFSWTRSARGYLNLFGAAA